MNKGSGTLESTDQQIIQTLRDAADADEVFTATRDWSMEKMRLSIQSRGDYFDRKGMLALEKNGTEVMRVCMCNLPITIGRGDKADCRLKFDGISRMHCRIEAIGNLIRLCDAGSKNGTWLNGKRIDYEDLCDGDIIGIGELSLRVKRL